MVYTSKEKVEIIKCWYETKSFVLVRRKFYYTNDVHFRKGPSKVAITRIIRQFENKHSLESNHGYKYGRKPVIKQNANNIEQVRVSVQETPKLSLRRRCQELNMSKTTMLTIMKSLEFCSFIIFVRHKLTDQDKIRRHQMCNWLSEKLERTPDWIQNVWFSDEAHFHLNGAVNNHNNIFWGKSKPTEIT